jgi:hypothetical protein
MYHLLIVVVIMMNCISSLLLYGECTVPPNPVGLSWASWGPASSLQTGRNRSDLS